MLYGAVIASTVSVARGEIMKEARRFPYPSARLGVLIPSLFSLVTKGYKLLSELREWLRRVDSAERSPIREEVPPRARHVGPSGLAEEGF